MTLTWIILVGVVFTVVGIACVAIAAIGLPGTWLLIAIALVVELLDRFYLPAGDRQTFNWWLIAGCLLLAGLGEVLELVSGALGARTAGSSRQGAAGALIGGICGIVGGFFIPVPVAGPIIGAVAGSFAGAVAGELIGRKRSLRGSLTPATGATIGRVLGTLSKLPIALAIWLMLSIAAFWP